MLWGGDGVGLFLGWSGGGCGAVRFGDQRFRGCPGQEGARVARTGRVEEGRPAGSNGGVAIGGSSPGYRWLRFPMNWGSPSGAGRRNRTDILDGCGEAVDFSAIALRDLPREIRYRGALVGSFSWGAVVPSGSGTSNSAGALGRRGRGLPGRGEWREGDSLGGADGGSSPGYWWLPSTEDRGFSSGAGRRNRTDISILPAFGFASR